MMTVSFNSADDNFNRLSVWEDGEKIKFGIYDECTTPEEIVCVDLIRDDVDELIQLLQHLVIEKKKIG